MAKRTNASPKASKATKAATKEPATPKDKGATKEKAATKRRPSKPDLPPEPAVVAEPPVPAPEPSERGELEEKWADQARLRILAIESNVRMRTLADAVNDPAEPHGVVAERARKLAAWLEEVGRSLGELHPVDALEAKQRDAAVVLVERLWSAWPQDEGSEVLPAIADLLDLTVRQDVTRAQSIVRLSRPRLGDLHPELVRLAAEAWAQGKRRGPMRVLTKALGLDPPSDEAIDSALTDR